MFFKNLKNKTYNPACVPQVGRLQPKTYNLQPSKAFTIMELLVIVFIVGILSVIIFKSVSSNRSVARDTLRLSDVKNMREALEFYFLAESSYPTSWAAGQPLVSPRTGKTFMAKMPTPPTPLNEGVCTTTAGYAYVQSGSDYNINYCLVNDIGSTYSGYKVANGNELALASSYSCTPDCSGHICGSDGCGGTCGSGCVVGDCSSDQTTCTADASTVFLAHFNNNIYDSSFSRTKFGMSSGYFSGSASSLAIPSSSDFDFGSNNFTLDFWINFTDVTTAGNVFVRYVDGNNYNNLYWSGSATGYFNYYQSIGGATQVQTYTGNLSLVNNTWYHVAFVRNGNGMLMFLNGVSKTLTQSPAPSGALTDLNSSYYIGGNPISGGTFIKAYIDEYRISKGLARWTSGFTPPTSAYTADANTQLLLHMDGGNGSTTFTDSETSAKTVTATNVVQYSGSILTNTNVTLSNAQAKFNTYSALFNGTNTSYFTVPKSSDFDFGSGNFTVDFWWRTPASWDGTKYYQLGSNSDSGSGNVPGWIFEYATPGAGNGRLVFLYTQSAGVYDYVMPTINKDILSTNTWYHIAAVKNGSNLTLYINGTMPATGPYTISNATHSVGASSYNLLIGNVPTGTGATIISAGYIDEYRISKGVARWTTNFTPPTLEY